MRGRYEKWGTCGKCKSPRRLRMKDNTLVCCGERRSSSTRSVWRFKEDGQ